MCSSAEHAAYLPADLVSDALGDGFHDALEFRLPLVHLELLGLPDDGAGDVPVLAGVAEEPDRVLDPDTEGDRSRLDRRVGL